MSAALLAPLALNVVRPDAPGDAGVPEWVQITPAGPALRGRDGRSWAMPSPDSVVAQFRADAASGVAVPVDLEHATETSGGPAVGWVEELEVRSGALWGRVAWNAAGRQALADRAFRFLSPAFLFDAATGQVLRLRSVGLTNRPNFPLPALNRANTETPMDPEVLTALGLAPAATPADAVAAIAALREQAQTALNRAAAPDPALFVPRADHQLALNRIAALEAAEAARAEAQAATEVDAAIAAGRVHPASRDYHLATCRAEGGLERFRALIAATPAHPAATPATARAAAPAGGPAPLAPEALALCRAWGADPEKIAAALAAEQR
jgi:phage I-like protein